jgi:hypothetical protein
MNENIDNVLDIISGKIVVERLQNGINNSVFFQDLKEKKIFLDVLVGIADNTADDLDIKIDMRKTLNEMYTLYLKLDKIKLLYLLDKRESVKILEISSIKTEGFIPYKYVKEIINVYNKVLSKYITKVFKSYKGKELSHLFRLFPGRCILEFPDKKFGTSGLVTFKDDFYLKIDSTKSDVKAPGALFKLSEVIAAYNNDGVVVKMDPVELEKKAKDENKQKIMLMVDTDGRVSK